MATKWKVLKYSKSEIARAGERLIENPEVDIFEYSKAIDRMENWRTAHAYPMHSVLMLMRGIVNRIDRNATIAQRLKRSASILLKLDRFKTMKLSRMQDIAGCRAIVKDQSKADKLRGEILKSRTRHKLHSEKNYVECPKDSGYRGYHMILKYGGIKKAYEGMNVEIQIRTRSQHAWATAVEVVGTFIGKSLKTGEGDIYWDEFFKLASAAISEIEKPKKDLDLSQDDIKRLIQLTEELNVLALLRAISASANYLQKMNRSESKSLFYLLKLDTRAGPNSATIEILEFSQADIEMATAKYGELEREFVKEKKVDVVLVAADSIQSLQQAYPNYFADTREFVRLITAVRDLVA